MSDLLAEAIPIPTAPFNPKIVLPVPMGSPVYWTQQDWQRTERLVGSPLRQDLFGYAWLADSINAEHETVYRRGPRIAEAPLPVDDPLTVEHDGYTWHAIEPKQNGQTAYRRGDPLPAP